jgi:glycosyltransferase involved in cell wall biosynthesis
VTGSPSARRAVVLVHNPLVSYSRAVRFGRTLAAAGWEVELVGTDGPGLPERDEVPPGPPLELPDGRSVAAGSLPIERVPHGGTAQRLLDPPWADLDRRLAETPLPTLGFASRTLLWPLEARAWSEGLRGHVQPADLYHACGLQAAWAARDLTGPARKAGRAGRVIYDLIDIHLESGSYAGLSPLRRRLFSARESRLVKAADGLTSASDPFADDAMARWHLPERPVVVYNGPFRSELTSADTDLVREATGIPAERAVVMFIGRFERFAGLLEAGEAVLGLPDAAFVAIGRGSLEAELQARDVDPAFAGRHFTLPPVLPEDVPQWAAAADATIFLSTVADLNQRLLTPNKLWESLAGGAPIVFSRGLEQMRRILEPEGLGVAVDRDDPAAIAAGLRTFLDEGPTQRADRRARARWLVSERYAWDVWVPNYLELADALTGGDGAPGRPAPARSRS